MNKYQVTIHRFSRETVTLTIEADDIAGAQYKAQHCLDGERRCQIKPDEIPWKRDPSPTTEIVAVKQV